MQSGKYNALIVKNLLTIHYNVAHTGKHTQDLRKTGLVDNLLPILKIVDNKSRLLALATLAELVDESEAQYLETSSDAIDDLISRLQKAVDSENGLSFMWSWELARGMQSVLRYTMTTPY